MTAVLLKPYYQQKNVIKCSYSFKIKSLFLLISIIMFIIEKRAAAN